MKKLVKYLSLGFLLILISITFGGCTLQRNPRHYSKPKKNCNCPSFGQFNPGNREAMKKCSLLFV